MEAHPRSPRDLAIASLAVLVVTLALFSPVRNQPFITFDDPEYITENDHVATGLTAENVRWAFREIHSANWHPLTWISHMIDVELFGLDPGPHHLVNAALHAINALLLLLFLVDATGRLRPAAVAALLFAVHPLHVESVAWASERKDTLSTFFFLLALIFHVRWARRRSIAAYLAVVLATAAGLMSKPMLVTLPFVLLLLDWWPLQRFGSVRGLRGVLVEKIPLFALVAGSIAITLHAQQEAMSPVSTGGRIANALLSYPAYLGKTIWPAGLSIIYPFRVGVPAIAVAASLVLLIALTALVVRCARRFPYLPMGWFWFLGTLVPVIGFVQVGTQSMADRYTYIPLIGIFIASAWLAFERLGRRAFLFVSTAVVLVLSVVTWRQIGIWRDPVTLFRHAVRVTERNPVAHLNLGQALMLERNFPAAAAQLRAAVEIHPRSAEAHAALGAALWKSGDAEGAARVLRAAIAIDPQHADALRTLGDVETARGNLDEAVGMYARAAAIRPDAETRAALETARNNLPEAIRLFGEAVRNRPGSADLRNDYAAALARAGRDAEALEQYNEALRLVPDHYDARMNVAALLSRMGREQEAAAHFERAARQRPDITEPQIYLALIYANLGRRQDAAAAAERALAIDPAAANRQFSSAVRIPFSPGNLDRFIATMRQ